MATTRINSVKSTLNLSISHILDPEKTKDGLYTESYCCALDATQAAEEFLSVRKRGTGRGNILAQHIRQSFNGYEVTPEQALKLGIELADKLLKGKYQYVIATHVNTKNIHNHIIAWEKNAEALAKYMHKGDKIVVLGKLGTHSWVNKDGDLRRKIEIVAKRIVFAESNPKLDQSDKNKLNPENYSMDEWRLIADQMNRDITENPPEDDLPF